MLLSEWILGGAMVVLAVALLILVLMQTGKDKKLSGTIAGGSSDTYLGRGQGKNRDKAISIATLIVAIVFAVVVVVSFVWFTYAAGQGWIPKTTV